MQSFGVNSGVLLNITVVLCSLNTDYYKTFRRKVSKVRMLETAPSKWHRLFEVP